MFPVFGNQFLDDKVLLAYSQCKLYEILKKILKEKKNREERNDNKVKRIRRQNVRLTEREKTECVFSELKTRESRNYRTVNICEA